MPTSSRTGHVASSSASIRSPAHASLSISTNQPSATGSSDIESTFMEREHMVDQSLNETSAHPNDEQSSSSASNSALNSNSVSRTTSTQPINVSSSRQSISNQSGSRTDRLEVSHSPSYSFTSTGSAIESGSEIVARPIEAETFNDDSMDCIESNTEDAINSIPSASNNGLLGVDSLRAQVARTPPSSTRRLRSSLPGGSTSNLTESRARAGDENDSDTVSVSTPIPSPQLRSRTNTIAASAPRTARARFHEMPGDEEEDLVLSNPQVTIDIVDMEDNAALGGIAPEAGDLPVPVPLPRQRDEQQTPRAISRNIPPALVSDSTTTIISPDLIYRDEDILLSLQLLAFLSKYPHVRKAFLHPHLAYTIGFPFPPEVPELNSPGNIFSLVERFTCRHNTNQSSMQDYGSDIQYWAGVIMRNACRRDDAKAGLRQCTNMECGKWETSPREFAKCRRCRKAKYCSKSCQSISWSAGHRNWCQDKLSESTGPTISTSAVPNNEQISRRRHSHRDRENAEAPLTTNTSETDLQSQPEVSSLSQNVTEINPSSSTLRSQSEPPQPSQLPDTQEGQSNLMTTSSEIEIMSTTSREAFGLRGFPVEHSLDSATGPQTSESPFMISDEFRNTVNSTNNMDVDM